MNLLLVLLRMQGNEKCTSKNKITFADDTNIIVAIVIVSESEYNKTLETLEERHS